MVGAGESCGGGARGTTEGLSPGLGGQFSHACLWMGGHAEQDLEIGEGLDASQRARLDEGVEHGGAVGAGRPRRSALECAPLVVRADRSTMNRVDCVTGASPSVQRDEMTEEERRRRS